MKLYVTLYSPYARMARIMVREKALETCIEEVIAQTRQVGSPYYQVNPSGRVPYLLRDDGIGMEDSALICTYLDHFDQAPAFERPSGEAGWEFLRLEAWARSLMDGVSVWIRELARPAKDRSATIIGHEIARSERLARLWETEIESPLMTGPFNYPQMTLACALQLDIWNPGFEWRRSNPKLVVWLDRISERQTLTDTAPS